MGGRTETILMLNSTQVEVKVEVGVELCNKLKLGHFCKFFLFFLVSLFFSISKNVFCAFHIWFYVFEGFGFVCMGGWHCTTTTSWV